jgi:hypothetical protein
MGRPTRYDVAGWLLRFWWAAGVVWIVAVAWLLLSVERSIR